jgi:hypothetical protein
MEARVEKLVGAVIFVGMTLSIGFYVAVFTMYPSRLSGIAGAFKGKSLLEAGFALFALMWIWSATTIRSTKLKILFGIMVAWLVVVSLQAFHSIPSFDIVLAVGVALEVAAIALYLFAGRKLGPQ